MKFIFPITLLFLMTGPVVANSANQSSTSTEQAFVASAAMGEEAEEKNPSGEQKSPTMQPSPNDPEAQGLLESITDHPAVISPPVVDPEIRITPPVTDPEMAVNPKNLPTNPEEDAPVFPR